MVTDRAKSWRRVHFSHEQQAMIIMPETVSLEDSGRLPAWRRPVFLLFVMTAALPLSFATWSALLNNFVVDVASFDGVGIGWLHTVREIPGFLAIGVIPLILLIREQALGIISLVLLGAATAIVAWFPSFYGLMLTTMISSIGFHYYETVNQSLQLQWIKKEKAPQTIGWMLSVSSLFSLIAYLCVIASWKILQLDYNTIYMVAGGTTVAICIFCYLAYPRFRSPHAQKTRMILRRRYWLYYALQFMSGARRQIFIVFAAFMMVEKFGFEVHEVTSLFIINFVANMLFAPVMGRAVTLFGERTALTFEYTGLVIVFLAYGGIYLFGWGALLAAILYILDHLFFALAFALKTYFQKICDPSDIAPTAAVAFTINHIAAVFLPALLGYLWLNAPEMVFLLAAIMALISLGLGLLVPRHPAPGRETIFSTGRL